MRRPQRDGPAKVRPKAVSHSRKKAFGKHRARYMSRGDSCTSVDRAVVPTYEAMNHSCKWPVAKRRPFFLARQMTVRPRVKERLR
jgi:hypothetical protein